jgi:hypothetical protein
MSLNIALVLKLLVSGLSDTNYEQTLARYRFWVELEQTYSKPSDLAFNTIWNHINQLPPPTDLILPTPPLILRFASDVDAESHGAGLLSRLCTSILKSFFNTGRVTYTNYTHTGPNDGPRHIVDANLIAHCANLGYIKEAAIRNHILQSLISYTCLYDHLADSLIVLFKIAGAAFGAYVDPSVIDRCFELLGSHGQRRKLIDVSELSQGSMVGTKMHLQDVNKLRQSGWKGLPPPPVFTAEEQGPIGTGQQDPNKTPAAIPLGLPNVDLEPQISPPPAHEPTTDPETEATPASPAPTQSPSISVATLSDFTMTDTPDDQSPIDPTEITPHDTFYLEDGNVEVLCESTLFRIHTNVLSFHSPVLRKGFTQAILATAESPNGCPRIPSSNTAMDFTTLLKIIYLPG